MLGLEDIKKLMKLMLGGDGKILEDVLLEFDSTFSPSVKVSAICALDSLLSMKEPKLFAPAQRMIAFAILQRANTYENVSSSPLTSILVHAACDEQAEKYERAFILGLLGIPIPPVNCAELLKQSASDYVRIMEENFKRVPPRLPPREALLGEFVSKTPEPFNSVFWQHAYVSNVIPDPDVPKGCNSSSTKFDNTKKLESWVRAEAAGGVSMEGLTPQWIRPFPPRVPSFLLENELLWLNPELKLVWDYGMCADAKAFKGEEQEQVMRDLADDPKLVEGFGKSEQEDLVTENPNPSTIENPQTEVAGLGLVAESLEKTELHNLPSESDNECEDQNGVVGTKTSGLCNESSHIVVNAIGSKSPLEITDAHEEAPPATSTASALELHSTNNKEILGGELNNLSSDKNADDDATGVCESQISPNETFSENLGSSDVGVDAVKFPLEGAELEGSGLQASPANDPKAQTVEEWRFQFGDMPVSSYKASFPDLLESFNITREAASNITWGSANIKFGTAHVEGTVYKSDGNSVISDGNLMLKENNHTEICKNGSVSVASSGTDEMCRENLSTKPATNPFHYLVRVPRFDDESLKERIKHQEIQLDDLTQQRDDIQVLLQDTRKASYQSQGVNYENGKNQVSSAWKLVRSKRVEMDSLQYKINKVKPAASIQDIDQRIFSMEYMMKHETIPLKQEKQFIHEIKQQKQLREQLSSNIGSHDEIGESREQLRTLEERMKILKKEYGILNRNAEKTEAAYAEAKKKCDDECKDLQARYRASNNSRQEAYNQLKSLRNELKVKNKHFYKDDETAANNYAHSEDRDTLHSLCKNQVEKFMELWNNNDKFRKEYVTFNAKSTVRRFGTLDGRALGPNEKRPIIPNHVDQKVHKSTPTQAEVVSVLKATVPVLKQETKLENRISNEETKKNLDKPKNTAAIKGKGAPARGSSSVSRNDVQVEVEPTKSAEEIELERKAEERRREDEAKLKEQLRSEEIAKAQDARERKKRQEEKAKKGAELRAQKEAKRKEKEREKRLRRKERKNALKDEPAKGSTSTDPSNPENAVETAQEIERCKEVSTCVIITGIVAAIAMILIFLYITYLVYLELGDVELVW